MKKRWQKPLSVLLAVAMMASMLTLPASAVEEAEGFEAQPLGLQSYTFDATKPEHLGTSVLDLADKGALTDGTMLGDAGFLKVVGSAAIKRGDSGACTGLETAKNKTGMFEFTTTSESTVTFKTGSNGTSNASIIALVNKTTGAKVAEASNKEVVTGSDKVDFTYTNLPAGTYQIASCGDYAGAAVTVGTTDNTAKKINNRGARLYSVTVNGTVTEGTAPHVHKYTYVSDSAGKHTGTCATCANGNEGKTVAQDCDTKGAGGKCSKCGYLVPLGKVTGLTATVKDATSVTLSWSAVVTATGYNVYVDGTKVTNTAVTATTYTATNLTTGTEYSFTVKAVRDTAEGDASDAATATPAAIDPGDLPAGTTHVLDSNDFVPSSAIVADGYNTLKSGAVFTDKNYFYIVSGGKIKIDANKKTFTDGLNEDRISSDIYRIQVDENGGAPLATWDAATVGTPVISSITKSDDGQSVTVKAKGVIVGDKDVSGVSTRYADKLSILFYQKGEGSDTLLASKVITASADKETEHTATFDFPISGTYYAKAMAYRPNATKMESANSAEVEAVLAVPAPAAPIVGMVNSTSLKVSWTAVPGVDGYNVYYKEGATGGTYAKFGATVTGTEVTVTGLTKGKVYSFVIAAVRGDEEGDKSPATLGSPMDPPQGVTTYTLNASKYVGTDTFTSKKISKANVTEKLGGLDVNTKGDNGFFTVNYGNNGNLNDRSQENPIKGQVFPDGTKAGAETGGLGGICFNFEGKSDATSRYIQFTTTQDNAKVKIWWECGGDGRSIAIRDSDAKVQQQTATAAAKKDSLYKTTFKLAEAGTYQVIGPEGKNLYYQVQVVYNEPDLPVANVDWATIKAPVISKAEYKKNDGSALSAIGVTVTDTMVGTDDNATVTVCYADSVLVELLDATGKVVDSVTSTTPGSFQNVTFTPTATGKYTVRATAVRKGDTSKVCAQTVDVDFTLKLQIPAIASVTSNGEGKATVKWAPVDEATAYEIYVDDALAATVDGGKTREYQLTGLTVGSTVNVTMKAVRGTEKTDASVAVVFEVTADAKREWAFTWWGERPVRGTNCDYKVGDADLNDASGSVRVWCIDDSGEGDGIGKIQLKSTNEGAFYYTPIPTSLNFTIKARIKVNRWRLSNGQEGMGMAVMDRVADPASGVGFWTNGYYPMATKTAYTGDKTGIRYDCRLGWAVAMQTGVTAKNLPLFEANDVATINANYKVNEAKDAPLESWADEAGWVEKEVNVVGNHVGKGSKPDAPAYETLAGTIDNAPTEIILEIKRDNTGWLFTSYDAKTGVQMKQVREYGTTALDQIDKDYVYAGFMVARGCDITASDVSITTIRPEDDAPAEEHPITAISPKATFASSTVANSPNYTLGIAANAIGTATISLNGQEILFDVPVRHDIRCDVPLELVEGENTIDVAFYPGTEAEQEWPDQWTILKNRNPSVFTATVKYDNTYSRRTNLYVAPDASGNGGGTIQSPMLLTRAVEVVQPGQTIVLMEGTYYLTQMVDIQRGVDGTEEKPIRMVADPEAGSRPVLDFQYACPGISLAASHWYLQGFDVIHTSNNEEALAISGSYNTVDQCRFHDNAGSGLQISRLRGSDSRADWPSYNLVLNCDSWNNSDLKYEDADGFAAKLTCGPGNVFDGCVAHHNSDDGWDLFAKVETGCIDPVVIKNCVAYSNGFLMDGTNAGNGNGFKMGGSSLPGQHMLYNSYSFYNKAKGIDSNSCPDIQAYNSVSWNNGSNNVAFYTGNATKTDFVAEGIISIKDATADEMPGKMLAASANKPTTVAENLKPAGPQKEDETKYKNASNFFYTGKLGQGANSAEETLTSAIFKSTEFKGITRNDDGTINMGDFLQFADDAVIPEGVGPTGESTPSQPVVLAPEPPAEPSFGGGGAGGGGAAAPSDDNTGDTTTPAPVVAEPIVVTPAASVDKDGNATVTVTNKVVNDAVKKAAETGADSLVIAPATKGEVNSMAVTIPADAVAAVANKSDMDVTVKSDVADVTIPNEALTQLAADKAGAITVTAANNDDGTVKVEVATASATLDTVPGGVKVAVPAGKGNVMVVVDAEGNEKVLVKSVVDGDKVAAKLPGSATVKVVDLSKSFDDVPASHWAKSAVDFTSARDIFKGVSDTSFAPSDNVNRAMMATVLFRLEEATAEGADVFADVAADTWYTEAVSWANKAGIVTGYSDAAFGPTDPVTREQMATMLFRYAKTLGLDTSVKGNMAKYADAANVSSWAGEAMTWAVGAGLINGTSATTLNPDLTASRAEVAIILERMVKLIVK